MAVTYAWRIDSNLYSYIVNPQCLTVDGNLDVAYVGREEDYMGYVSTTKVSSNSETKIQYYCKNKFAVKDSVGLQNYTAHFDYMMAKIHAFNPLSGDNMPYLYVDLQSPETYFNVDSDCSSLRGEKGEPAIIEAVNTSFAWVNTEAESAASVSVITKKSDMTYANSSESIYSGNTGYTYAQLQAVFSSSWIIEHENDWVRLHNNETYVKQGRTVGVFFNGAGTLIGSAQLIDAPDYLYNIDTQMYYLRRDTNDEDNRYVFDVDIKMPKSTGTYNPQSELMPESERIPGTLQMPLSVGGLSAGTTAASLSGETFSEIFNKLLFPELYPTNATLPSASISLKSTITSPKIYGLGRDITSESTRDAVVTEINSTYLTGSAVNTSYTEGHFNATGYTINAISGVTHTENLTISPASITGDDITPSVITVNYTDRVIYTAPVNSPLTSKGNVYSAASATWVASSTTVTTKAYVVISYGMSSNFDATLDSSNVYQSSNIGDTLKNYTIYPYDKNQTVFQINYTSTTSAFMINCDRISEIAIYNELQHTWDVQDSERYTKTDNTYTLKNKVAGLYKITLSRSLDKD